MCIRDRIQAIIDGKVAYEASVIHNAPYTAAAVASDNWEYSFTRQEAAYPVASLRANKYFPPVRRINEAYGDRNLVCACPPPEAFEVSADAAAN